MADDAEKMFEIGTDLSIYKLVSSRLATFCSWKYSHIISAKQLAESGFIYSQVRDRVQCVYCRGILEDFKPRTSANAEHYLYFFRICPYIRNYMLGVVILKDNNLVLSANPQSQYQHLENNEFFTKDVILNSQILYPEFETFSNRLMSFRDNWSNCELSPHTLAECGMFFGGVTNYVHCFYCGVGINLSEDIKDFWKIKARINPFCMFLIQKRGRDYIFSSLYDARVSQQMEYCKAILPPKQIYDEVERSHDSIDLETKISFLENKITCKICISKQVSTVFLNCGHIVACFTCALKLKKKGICPMCRGKITRVQNIFYG